MSKIAYLIGESGAGKSHLSKRLRAGCDIEVVFGDVVLSRAAQMVPPESIPGEEMHTGGWLKRASHPLLSTRFREVMVDCSVTLCASRRPVLAEATLFCILGLWEAFHSAIRDLRPDIVEAKLFYLKVSPQTLVDNIAGRDRKEVKIGVKEARKRIAFLEGRLAQHGPVWCGSYDEADREIRQYLGIGM